MFVYRGGGLFKKGCEASRFIKEGMTTITGSVGMIKLSQIGFTEL